MPTARPPGRPVPEIGRRVAGEGGPGKVARFLCAAVGGRPALESMRTVALFGPRPLVFSAFSSPPLFLRLSSPTFFSPPFFSPFFLRLSSPPSLLPLLFSASSFFLLSSPHLRVRACVYPSVRACVCPSVRACVRACASVLRACVSSLTHVCPCVRACIRPCVSLLTHVCPCVRAATRRWPGCRPARCTPPASSTTGPGPARPGPAHVPGPAAAPLESPPPLLSWACCLRRGRVSAALDSGPRRPRPRPRRVGPVRID